MDNDDLDLALWKLSVLGPLVSARLDHGGRRAWFEEVSERQHQRPDGRLVRVSPRTIEAWFYTYRRGGLLDSNQVLEQYEALRRNALDAGSSFDRGPGLSLFLTRGMSAWLTALTALMPRSSRTAMLSEPPQFERPLVLAPGVRSDLTVMLADMVLACSVEVAG